MSAPRRLFIALGLTNGARRQLHAAVAGCAPAEARPTAPANYHLTLVFIGDAAPAGVETCRRTLAACAPATLPALRVERIAPFPGPESRLIAAHLHPSAELNVLQRCLARGTATITDPSDQRLAPPYHPGPVAAGTSPGIPAAGVRTAPRGGRTRSLRGAPFGRGLPLPVPGPSGVATE